MPPDITAVAPDGSKHVFPDGTSQDVIDSVMKSYISGAQPTVPKAGQPGAPAFRGHGAGGSFDEQTPTEKEFQDPFSTASIVQDPNPVTRTLRYMGGEGMGIENALGGMIKGTAKLASDVAMGVAGFGNPDASAQDFVGAGKGLLQMAKAPFQSETYTDPQKFGAEVTNVASLIALGAKGSGFEDLPKAEKLNFTQKAALTRDHLHQVASNFISQAVGNAETRVDALANNIEKADAADISNSGKQGSIPTKNVLQAMQTASNVLRQAGQTMRQADAMANKLDQFGGTDVDFATAKQIRTLLGKAEFSGNISASEKAIISSGYKTLTDGLRSRAQDLGLSRQFDAYNKIFSETQKWREGVLGKLENAPDSSSFFKVLENKGNAGQLLNLQKDLSKFGMSSNFFQKAAEQAAPLHEFLEKPGSSSFQGMYRSILRHPMIAFPAYMAMRKVGGWIGGMAGASAASNLMDKIAMNRTINEVGGVPKVTGNFSGAPDVPTGATIGEQLAAKGQEAPQVKVNGSGESAASQEAINRTRSEQAKGIRYIAVDSRTGGSVPITGVDAADRAANAMPYERTYKVGPDGSRELVAEGKSAVAEKPQPKPQQAQAPDKQTQQVENKVQDVLQRSKGIAKIKRAQSVLEKAKDSLSDEDYKIASEFLRQELAKRASAPK